MLVFVLSVQLSYAQKLDPELTVGLPVEGKLTAILIAEHKLNGTELQQLSAFGVNILKNFTLPWYEIEIPSVNIAELEKLDFVKEIKYTKEYRPLINETKADGQTDYSILAAVAIALILILTFYALRKSKILAFIFLFLFLSTVTFASEGKGKIDPLILSENSDTVNIIAEMDGYPSKYLQAHEMKKFAGGFYAMKIPKSEVTKLEKMGSVKRAWLEKKYNMLLDVAVPLINTTNFLSSGYNGSGVKVCVLDTGVNKSHSALSSRVTAEKDFVTTDSDGDNPTDFHGHGTHVAGIVASTDSTYRGVAFGSSILNAKVFSSTTEQATDTDIISAIDWCIAQNASILTLSLGGPDATNDGSDALSQYVDSAVDQGKIVTIAAGNSGSGENKDCRTASDGATYSICSPGLAHKVITVGSTQSGKAGSSQDVISGFSSRGPTKDERIKPDVTAPGQPINSTWINGGFNSISGTSMSTPMVAGLAALILQARNITAEELKALIMNTAVDLGATGKDNSYGAGRVNGSRLFNEINNTARATIRNESRIHNIFVPANTEIRATLYWPENYSVHNNIDLQLLDPAGNVRALSGSVNNTDEIVNATSAIAGNWKLLVNPVNVSSSQAYALAANYKPSGQMYMAANNISGTAYHQINLTTSSKLTINLDWNSSGINMDLYLYNTTGWLVNYSNATNTNYENISINAEAGIWLARLVSNQSNVSYSLSSPFSVSSQISDNVSPNVTLTEPLNKTYATQNINLTLTIADNLNAVASCSMVLDNAMTSLGTVQNNSTRTYNFSASVASHSIYASCTDAANNTGNSSVVNFTVDSTLPNITFVSPTDTNNSFVGRNYTFINASVSDLNGIDTCTLQWNSTNYPMTKAADSCFLNRTDSDGTYNYRVLANDSAGNVNFTERTITFDTTLPSAAVVFSGGNNNSFSPNGDGVFDTITFNITASETVDFGTTYLISENGARVKRFNAVANTNSIQKPPWDGSCTSGCTNAPDGIYYIQVNMTDTTGNINITNLTTPIIVDTTRPSISFIGPTPNNETLLVDSIVVNVTASEAVASVLLEWNGINETMTGSGRNWSKAKTDLADANYTFRVYANDTAGNWNVTETRWVAINATRNVSAAISNINQTLAARGIKLHLLSSAGGIVNDGLLLPHVNYTLRFNISNVLVETADFLSISLNASAIINITNNITAEANISSTFGQTGGSLDSYAWVDLNNLLPIGNFTAKITFPRIYAIYFYLNGTKDAPNMTRVLNACNANTSNVPCYNLSANTSTLYLPSFSGGAGGNDIKAPLLNVISPTSTAYTSSSILLNYSASDNVALDRCWYSLNAGSNINLTNCTNDTIPVADGSNTITIYVNDTSNNINSTTITFTVAPATTTTAGGGGGSFFQEENKTTTTIKEENNTLKGIVHNDTNYNREEPDNKNENPIINITSLPDKTPTGLAASQNNLIIGVIIVIVSSAFLIWKFKPPRKRFKFNKKKRGRKK